MPCAAERLIRAPAALPVATGKCHTDALTECVITWDCNGQEIKTRGVHSNQVFAGILAALRIINLQLHERTSGQGVLSAPDNLEDQA